MNKELVFLFDMIAYFALIIFVMISLLSIIEPLFKKWFFKGEKEMIKKYMKCKK